MDGWMNEMFMKQETVTIKDESIDPLTIYSHRLII